jgi:hypothetical protein
MLAVARTSNRLIVDLLVRQHGRLCLSSCNQNAPGRLAKVAYIDRFTSNSISFRRTSIRPNAINNKKEQEDKQPHRLCHAAEAIFVQGVAPAEFRPPRPAAAAPPTQSPAPTCAARSPSTPTCWLRAAAPAALAPPPGDAQGWHGFPPTTWSTLEQDWDIAKGMWVDLAVELNLDYQLSSSGSLMHKVVGCSLLKSLRPFLHSWGGMVQALSNCDRTSEQDFFHHGRRQKAESLNRSLQVVHIIL